MKNYAVKQPQGYDTPPNRFGESLQVATHLLGPTTPTTKRIVDVAQSLPKTDYCLLLWEIIGMQRWSQFGMPSLYASDDIVWACKNTEAMNTVTGNDIKTTFPSVLINIPRSQQWKNRGGCRVSHIILNVYDDNQNITARLGGVEESIVMPDVRYLMLNCFWTDFGCQSITVPLKADVSVKESFDAVAAGDPLVSAFQTPQMVELAEDDEVIGWQIAECVTNMMLVMQSYPKYITKSQVKTRLPGQRKAKAKTTRVILGKPSDLRQEVEHDPRKPESENSKGSENHRRPHLRSGHWRRQRHRDDWELANPDVGIVVMPDGGHAHMAHIEPLWIEPSQGGN